MNTQFIADNDTLISSRINPNTAVVSEFGEWIKGITIEYLNYSQLKAFYSIKAGSGNIIEHWKYRQLEPSNTIKKGSNDLNISDIAGVHLVSSSGVIVAEQTDLSCTEGGDLLTIIDNLVLDLPDKTFLVVIEADCNNTKKNHTIEVEATHILLAVSIALDKLMTLTYEEKYNIDNIARTIDGCVRNNEDVAINFFSGNTYKLLSVKPAVELN